VHRIVEVSFSDNAEPDATVVANNAVVAAYASRTDRPELPFWPLLFSNTTLRLLGSDDFTPEDKQQAAADLTAAAQAGVLRIPIAAAHQLHDIAPPTSTSTTGPATAGCWSRFRADQAPEELRSVSR
jgi:NADPH2:quinone reductase